MLVYKSGSSECYNFGVYLKLVTRSVMIRLLITAWLLFAMLCKSLILKDVYLKFFSSLYFLFLFFLNADQNASEPSGILYFIFTLNKTTY